MTLERWDAALGRWIMYARAEQQSEDCRSYPFSRVPKRIFLDTNIVNLMVKYRRHVFEQEPIPADLHPSAAHHVEALMHLFSIGFRAGWDLVVSRETINEIERTVDPYVRGELLDYAWEVSDEEFWEYSENSDFRFAGKLGRSFAQADMMSVLPDESDRILIGHAIGLACDAFCTRDLRTIVNKRHKLPPLPISIMTPVEWWKRVKPWAGLWA